MIYSPLKKLLKKSQPKLIKLIRLDTISNVWINVIWREVYDRERKVFKKIDANKRKNSDVFVDQLINIINSEIVLLKTTVMVKLNTIISDLKVKSGMDNVYNFNDKDKLSKIDNDLDKYMKHLKKDIWSIKIFLKTISANQTD